MDSSSLHSAPTLAIKIMIHTMNLNSLEWRFVFWDTRADILVFDFKYIFGMCSPGALTPTLASLEHLSDLHNSTELSKQPTLHEKITRSLQESIWTRLPIIQSAPILCVCGGGKSSHTYFRNWCNYKCLILHGCLFSWSPTYLNNRFHIYWVLAKLNWMSFIKQRWWCSWRCITYKTASSVFK